MPTSPILLAALAAALVIVAAIALKRRIWPQRDRFASDPGIWIWFDGQGDAKDGSGDTEPGDRQMFHDGFAGHEIPNLAGAGPFWVSTNEARFRTSVGTWHLIYEDPVSAEAVLKHAPQVQDEAEAIWRERTAAAHHEKVAAADLDGRLPNDGEMYKGLGLYLCRNLMETYRPGMDYEITLSPDGGFENITPLEPDAGHQPEDYPIDMGPNRTRYSGLAAALEALAGLMQGHGNQRHAEEFRREVGALAQDD